MIPKKIHYCWFGKGEMPELVQTCIASWRTHMPNWEYRLWSEDTIAQVLCQPTPSHCSMNVHSGYSIEQSSSPIKGGENESAPNPSQNWLDYMPKYVQEAYAAKKYAFVSDYVRLWALEQEGGVYLDTDVEVLCSFDPLLDNTAFIGLEESLALMPGTCVMGCEAHCQWATDMLSTYEDAHFLREDDSLDMTTNVQRLGAKMVEGGLLHERKIQYLPQWGLRVYTHDYFSPITSTRVMRKTRNTYCIHRFAGSWVDGKKGGIHNWWIVREIINALVQIKRIIFNMFS